MKGSFLIVCENYQHYQQFNHSVIEIFYMGGLCVMRRGFAPNKEWDVDLRALKAGVLCCMSALLMETIKS